MGDLLRTWSNLSVPIFVGLLVLLLVSGFIYRLRRKHSEKDAARRRKIGVYLGNPPDDRAL